TEVWFETMVRAMRAMMRGRLAEGERLANEAVQLGEFGQDRSFQITAYWVQMCTLRVLQDRADELEPVLLQFLELPSALPAWRTSLMWAYSAMDRRDEVRRELEDLSAGDFRVFPKDATWLSAMTSVADAVADIDDVEVAPKVYSLLEPYADRCGYVGPVAVFIGSIRQYLGRLLTTMGRFDEA